MNSTHVWHNLQKNIILNKFFKKFENNIGQEDKIDKILNEIDPVLEFLIDIFFIIH